MDKITERVQNYWTVRAHDFNTVRINELNNSIGDRWISEFETYFRTDKKLKILDVGTGTGYFAILLAKLGHEVTGIDITKAMLDEAVNTALKFNVCPTFMQMDAQSTSFSDATFDAVVTRNLTWTLPDPGKAYSEWYRILNSGGVLLNFDADYASNVRNSNQKNSYVKSSDIYGHCGITPALEHENAEITLSMPCSRYERPQWDMELLSELGYSNYGCDPSAGVRILGDHDLSDAPLFLVYATK